MVTIISTPGALDANSYATIAEANQYFNDRLPLSVPWIGSGDTEGQAMVMAARYIDAMASPMTMFNPPSKSSGGAAGQGSYVTRPHWTGQPATSIQRMAWPRIGMFDRNGNPIDEATIPLDLKYAQCEFAGQLKITDTTLNNDVIVQGITSVKAGSVAVSFKDQIPPRVWPDAVWNLLVPSWLTPEIISYVSSAQFETLYPLGRV